MSCAIYNPSLLSIRLHRERVLQVVKSMTSALRLGSAKFYSVEVLLLDSEDSDMHVGDSDKTSCLVALRN